MSNKTSPYEIGQIVYILSDKAQAIIPAMIVEEVVVKKLDGNTTSWKVAIGPPSKKKIVKSDEISGEIYSSAEEARKIMMERFEKYVNKLSADAKKRTQKWYGKQINAKKQQQNDAAPEKIDPETLVSKLDEDELNSNDDNESNVIDGEQNNVTLPPINGPLKPSNNNSSVGNPREALREQLKAMATPEETEENTGGSEEKDYLITNDGKKVPIVHNNSGGM